MHFFHLHFSLLPLIASCDICHEILGSELDLRTSVTDLVYADDINPLEVRVNCSATSNNMKLVH